MNLCYDLDCISVCPMYKGHHSQEGCLHMYVNKGVIKVLPRVQSVVI